jgi:hypothetical protein
MSLINHEILALGTYIGNFELVWSLWLVIKRVIEGSPFTTETELDIGSLSTLVEQMEA